MDIKALRIQFGYSVRELSELVGVHLATAYRWDKGDCKPSHDQTMKLQELFTEKKQDSEIEENQETEEPEPQEQPAQ